MQTARHTPRHTRRAHCRAACWALSATSLLLSACAIGPVGTQAAWVQTQGSVTTVHVYSLGLHLRSRPDDLGAHLGWSRRSAVFAADAALQPGWHFLAVPSPPQQALAQDLMTLGIELSAVAPLAGLALGYSRNQLYARLPADSSVYLALASADRQIIHLITCSETTPCPRSPLAH